MNTRLLFLALLRDLRIELVCDVGSMNGADALAFRKRLPRATVIAWEPNPANLQGMRSDRRLVASGVELVAAAAADVDGSAPFFLVPADYPLDDARRGRSSLYPRDDPEQVLIPVPVPVPTQRLDGALAERGLTSARIALWIDTEGKAYEVIEGARKIAAQVQLLHVEVESTPCINARQRLYPDVNRLLVELGFEQLASDHSHCNPQFNAVYVRRDQSPESRRRISLCLRRARLRRGCVAVLRKLCPSCVHRLATLRDHLASR
ncbi:MAG TPA: FkbM family methyltransferase [Steroidobacteraceae bacterium]|nr:FkbM family methyltransferase [Steroidobacteraceae bacterium]